MPLNKLTDAELQERFSQYRQRLRDIVTEHGWAVQGVLDEPPLSYTVGLLASYGHPELVVRGLPPDVAQSVLNGLGSRVRQGECFVPGAEDDKVFHGFKARFVGVTEAAAFEQLKAAREFAQDRHLRAVQLLWPDTDGVTFPDSPQASERLRRTQPLLSAPDLLH